MFLLSTDYSCSQSRRKKKISECKDLDDTIRLGRIDVNLLQDLTSNQQVNIKEQSFFLCGSRDFEIEIKTTLVQGMNVPNDNVLSF